MKGTEMEKTKLEIVTIFAVITMLCCGNYVFAGMNKPLNKKEIFLEKEYKKKIELLEKEYNEKLKEMRSGKKISTKKYEEMTEEEKRKKVGSFVYEAEKNLKETVDDPDNLKQNDVLKALGIE